jgi:hypothetical protein
LKPDVIYHRSAKARSILNSLSGSEKRSVNKISDGNIEIENISGDCEVSLESRNGSIVVKHDVSKSARAKFKAAGAVTIRGGIDEHSIVEIIAGGDVTISRVDHNSRAIVTSISGNIEICSKVSNFSSATLSGRVIHIDQGIGEHSSIIATAHEDVMVDGDITGDSTADIISLNGAICVSRGIGDRAVASLTAGKTVRIGGRIDHLSNVTVLAQSDVRIGQEIKQNSVVAITSLLGSIHIEQGLSGCASATFIARNGTIRIDSSVAPDTRIVWNAQSFSCLHDDGAI